MEQNRDWTYADYELLRKLYPAHTAKYIAKVLDRSVMSIHHHAHLLGLERPLRSRRKCTNCNLYPCFKGLDNLSSNLAITCRNFKKK